VVVLRPVAYPAPMTPEREREIRELADRLAAGPRHKRIAAVLAELLDELDEQRRLVGEWEERFFAEVGVVWERETHSTLVELDADGEAQRVIQDGAQVYPPLNPGGQP
jgi:hypothetical protein